MEHCFNPKMAAKYGIEEAILFQDLRYWCLHNKENDINKHEYNGKVYYWTYNSCAAMAEKYEYMSPAKISRTLKKLEEKGLIVSSNFNQVAYDRTKWYAITEEADKEYCEFERNSVKPIYKNEESISQKCKMEVTKMENGFCEIVEPIPNTNTDTDSNTNTNLSPISSADDNSQVKESKNLSANADKKPRKASTPKTPSYSRNDYNECYEIITSNIKILKDKGITVSDVEYPYPVLSKMLKAKFNTYGVENTKKGLMNSVNNSWLVNNVHYAINALFSDKLFPQFIANSNTSSTSTPTTKDKVIDYQSQDFNEVF